MKKLLLFAIIGIFLSACKKSVEEQAGLPAPPVSLQLDPFYKKYLDAEGIPILSSEKVADEAFYKVKSIVVHMLKMLPAEKAKMIENKIRVGIIGKTERTTEMPEFRDLYTAFPGTDWDVRTRGVGATLARPLCTNAEENVLCLPGDKWHGEDILTHEFAHSIHELGLKFTKPNFDNQLQAAFNNAKAKGLWTNTYAITDYREYWAEGVQTWFNTNIEAIPTNGIHNQVNTRDELKTYDTMLYNLIKTYFADDTEKHGCY